MQKLIRLLVVVLLALCLPLQGVAGITMPACAEQQAPLELTADEAAMSSHCMHEERMHEERQQQGGKTLNAKCYACHLGIAQAIAPHALTIADAGAVASYFEGAAGEYRTLLSTPYHPPKSIPALG